MNIKLVCWSCGKQCSAECAQAPQFGFELALIATQVGWLAPYDFNRGRVLLFCSQGCQEEQMTKAGVFRLRPRRRAAEQQEAQP